MELEAGRELDARVGEQVMNWRWLNFGRSYGGVAMLPPEEWQKYLPEYLANNTVVSCTGNPPERLPRFSSDIAAAWAVIEKMREREIMVSVSWGKDGGWWCSIRRTAWPFEGPYADAAPLAICLAALAVSEGKEEA